MQEVCVQVYLKSLILNLCEVLLLCIIEELCYDQIVEIMQIDQDEVEELVQIVLVEMLQVLVGKVMVIEDEMIIVMDLKGIV